VSFFPPWKKFTERDNFGFLTGFWSEFYRAGKFLG